MIYDTNEIKIKFKSKFDEVLLKHPSFKFLLYEIFVFGTAYLVGGFLRDIINNKEFRDLDIIIDLEHSKLIELITESNIDYEVNRHNGIKLKLTNTEIDLWSIQNNWAFKNKLVKLNENDKLNSIAKGCFYNYDALVINLHKYNFSIKFYNEFLDKKELDILQKSPAYKRLNPTVEANILRAFYLKKKMGVEFSNNTKEYLISKIGYINDKYGSAQSRLIKVKTKYPKYNLSLDNRDIQQFITELMANNQQNQLFLYS